MTEYRVMEGAALVSCDNATQLWLGLLDLVLATSTHGMPRGHHSDAFDGTVTAILTDVHRPFVTVPARNANYRFGLCEAAWYLSGSDDVETVARFNKRIREFSDDGITFWGAYGPRLMREMPVVMAKIRRDQHTRQAVITTWRPTDEVVDTKDVPCTIAWHFQVRDDKLDLTVFMRSNDLWLGFPYDILSFTSVQRVVAAAVGFNPGRYTHVVSNLHLYSRDLEAARAVQALPRAYPIDDPIMPPVTTTAWVMSDFPAHVVQTTFLDIINHRPVTDDVIGLEPFIAALSRDPSAVWSGWEQMRRATRRP